MQKERTVRTEISASFPGFLIYFWAPNHDTLMCTNFRVRQIATFDILYNTDHDATYVIFLSLFGQGDFRTNFYTMHRNVLI
jgi:hypothetical protein